MKTYVLAGGCFWCLDAVFRRLNGVISSECGYTGGSKDSAHYYAVATGGTGHAESLRVTFDDTVLPPEVLLDVFFLIHNPTTLNRQGADVGTQYRSAMFYTDDIERSEFEAARDRAQAHWDNMIVTDIVPLLDFYSAEPEHQNYFDNNPSNGYCSIVIEPKITKARAEYLRYFRP